MTAKPGHLSSRSQTGLLDEFEWENHCSILSVWLRWEFLGPGQTVLGQVLSCHLTQDMSKDQVTVLKQCVEMFE